MMSEYSRIFDARGGHYNLANRNFPLARADEARRFLEHLDPPARGAVVPWLDVAAGGGYAAECARARAILSGAVACDASLGFVAQAHVYGLRCVGDYSRLPFRSAGVAAAGSLAALHHCEDPAALVEELLRVVAPGGRAAIADAAAGSKTVAFLNGFVNAHTRTGHCGRFLDATSLGNLFRRAGACEVREETVNVTWTLPTEADAAAFARELFGLADSTRDDEIRQALAVLGASAEPSGYSIPWTMIFASARV